MADIGLSPLKIGDKLWSKDAKVIGNAEVTGINFYHGGYNIKTDKNEYKHMYFEEVFSKFYTWL